MKVTESQLKAIITESIKKVLREENEILHKLLKDICEGNGIAIPTKFANVSLSRTGRLTFQITNEDGVKNFIKHFQLTMTKFSAWDKDTIAAYFKWSNDNFGGDRTAKDAHDLVKGRGKTLRGAQRDAGFSEKKSQDIQNSHNGDDSFTIYQKLFRKQLSNDDVKKVIPEKYFNNEYKEQENSLKNEQQYGAF